MTRAQADQLREQAADAIDEDDKKFVYGDEQSRAEYARNTRKGVRG